MSLSSQHLEGRDRRIRSLRSSSATKKVWSKPELYDTCLKGHGHDVANMCFQVIREETPWGYGVSENTLKQEIGVQVSLWEIGKWIKWDRLVSLCSYVDHTYRTLKHTILDNMYIFSLSLLEREPMEERVWMRLEGGTMYQILVWFWSNIYLLIQQTKYAVVRRPHWTQWDIYAGKWWQMHVVSCRMCNLRCQAMTLGFCPMGNW